MSKGHSKVNKVFTVKIIKKIVFSNTSIMILAVLNLNLLIIALLYTKIIILKFLKKIIKWNNVKNIKI